MDLGLRVCACGCVDHRGLTVQTNTLCFSSTGPLSLSAFDETATRYGNEKKTSKVFLFFLIWIVWENTSDM